jgi:GT2 family glycosyltransferase
VTIVPIIIPFYREYEKLRKCQAAISAQTYRDCETFVRDNTHDNILYTAAINEGLAKYCYRPDVRYVLVLNQDAYMQKDCVRQLVEFMDAHPQCGIACPLQYVETGNMQWRGPGAPLTVTKARAVTWGGSYQAFPLGVHRQDPFDSYKAPFETFWANGACMMIRTEVVREIGVFDKNMRFICSDADFSFTARARGWEIFVVPQALVEHALSGSGADAPLELQLVKCRDAAYFTQKWLDGGQYRQLAYEGPELTSVGVRQQLDQLKRDVRNLEQRLGKVSGTGDSLPSMFFKMQLSPMRPPFGRR